MKNYMRVYYRHVLSQTVLSAILTYSNMLGSCSSQKLPDLKHVYKNLVHFCVSFYSVDDGQLVIDEAPTEPTPAKTPDNKRAAYCRRCQVHGFKNLLRGHKDHCAFKGCWCNECRIISLYKY